jgi:hypothetical protein
MAAQGGPNDAERVVDRLRRAVSRRTRPFRVRFLFLGCKQVRYCPRFATRTGQRTEKA